MIGFTTLDNFVGVSINGVLLYTGASELGYDAFYPKAYGGYNKPTVVEADICLGSSFYTKAYHYYMFSPCIYDSPIKTTAMRCASDSLCASNKV